jgi:putative addiction module killer protein
MSKTDSDKIVVKYYEDENGRQPFAKFFNRVSGTAAAKVAGAITRLRAGNTADSKSVGKGISELRINWGPGYRLYYGWDGDKLIILLSGGLKRPKSSSRQILRKPKGFGPTIKNASAKDNHNAAFKRI